MGGPVTSVPEPNLGPVPVIDPSLRPPAPLDEDPTSPAPEVPEPEEDEGEQVTELTDDERHLFSQLVTVGQRSKTISVMGHEVTINNLRVSDDLRIGLYCKPYEGSKMEQRAFQVAVCAAGIREIDGAPLYQSLTPQTEDESFDKKVAILKDFYPVVITEIYREVMALDQEFVELAMKLGKLKG